MAFVDTLVAHTGAEVVLVDRRHRPGGHWLDAYPFVRLHQPSAYYGVESRPLGNDCIDEHGPNAGFYERASAANLRLLRARARREPVADGQVRFFGVSEYRRNGDGHLVVSLLDGSETVDKAAVQGRRRDLCPVGDPLAHVPDPRSNRASSSAAERPCRTRRARGSLHGGRGGKTAIDTAGCRGGSPPGLPPGCGAAIRGSSIEFTSCSTWSVGMRLKHAGSRRRRRPMADYFADASRAPGVRADPPLGRAARRFGATVSSRQDHALRRSSRSCVPGGRRIAGR